MLASLVMPVWQPRPEWLAAAVESALGQRGCDVELVVVDDGNAEPVEPLLPRDEPRVRVVRVEHGGVAAARNAGIREARGDVFRFVDADDVLDAGSTARLLGLLGGRDDGIAYGATMFCDGDLRPLWKMTCRVEGDASVPCLLGRFTVRHPSLLFPRRVVEATGPWDPRFRVSQDWDYVLRATEHARVVGQREVATLYRKHRGSQTSDLDAGERAGREVVDRYFERHPEQRGTPLERRARGALEAMLARVHVTHGNGTAALGAAQRSLALDPWALPRQALLSSPALLGAARAKLEGLGRNGRSGA